MPPAGYQFVTLKYGTTFLNGGSLKSTSWTDANIPRTFYSNSGAGGDHIPSRIMVQRKLTTDRAIFVTGTSWGGSTLNDWATMFTKEH